MIQKFGKSNWFISLYSFFFVRFNFSMGNFRILFHIIKRLSIFHAEMFSNFSSHRKLWLKSNTKLYYISNIHTSKFNEIVNCHWAQLQTLLFSFIVLIVWLWIEYKYIYIGLMRLIPLNKRNAKHYHLDIETMLVLHSLMRNQVQPMDLSTNSSEMASNVNIWLSSNKTIDNFIWQKAIA